ncbi:host nuclease inhibitor protein [Pseudomonas sp.]|uniref:host nuclease inhibitor protein n=1 Tax=Pseudomonas sp. TaxID=306 RepID=UPI00261BA4E2|nr:host nuclease inhibitor protein [Pseudomonas sp.]
MEQAQVYASAWSLVGGPFDKGAQLDLANEEKELLQEQLEEFEADLKDASREPGMLEIAQGLIKWHQGQMATFEKVLNTPADTEVRLGSDDDPIILQGEKLKGFRIGLAIAKSWIEKFPLSIERNAPDSDEEE